MISKLFKITEGIKHLKAHPQLSFTSLRTVKMAQASTERINFFVATLVKNDFKAHEIHILLTTAWGEDVKSLRRVQEIAKEIRDGERESCKRKDGSGRRASISTDENIQRVRTLIDEDPHVSVQYISTHLEIPTTTVHRIIRKHLEMKSAFARWIPHSLTDDHKSQRVHRANELIDSLNGSVVVVDEKWIYARPLPPLQHCRSWIHAGGDRPIKLLEELWLTKNFTSSWLATLEETFFFMCFNLEKP